MPDDYGYETGFHDNSGFSIGYESAFPASTEQGQDTRGSTALSSYQDPPSPWGQFARALFQNRGELLQGYGKSIEGQGMGSLFDAMSSRFGLQGANYGQISRWADLGMVFPQLQEQVIGIQTDVARKQSLDKWSSRISSVRARTARAGIAVDAGADSPMKNLLTLLQASSEEARAIEVDRSVRMFNEVTMPGIETRLKSSQAEYQSDLMKINQDLSLRMADISTSAANGQMYMSIVGAVGKAAGSVAAAGNTPGLGAKDAGK